MTTQLEWEIVAADRKIIDRRSRCAWHLKRLLRLWCCCTSWLNAPCSYICVPASVELTAAEIEGNLNLVADLIFIKISNLVISPYIHTHLCREISFLIFEDELLFRPSTSCRGACLNIKFAGDSALKFQSHQIDYSAGTYLPTLRTSTSKIRVELGSMLRLPREP